MFKANVAASTNVNPVESGREAAAKAAKGLQDIKAAFVYTSCAYDVKAVLSGVQSVLPGVPVFGNTSFTGVITPEGYVGGDTPFTGVMLFSDPEMTVGVASAPKDGCSVKKGEAIAKAALAAADKNSAPDYFYMAASPAEEEFYLKGISKVIGRVPFFGGSAADNTIAGEWKLYAQDQIFADGCLVAFFYNAPKMANLFTGAYRETEDFGVITKVIDHRKLAEIDGAPALKVYAEWLGVGMDQVTGGNLLATSITSPLGVKDRLGNLVAIRHPMNGNDDFSMSCGNNLAEKTCVIRMEATVDELINSTGDTLKALIATIPGKPLAFHLVHCGGRRAGIGDRINEVAAQLKAAAGDIPFITEFTFGEYGFVDDDRNTCGGLMLSFTGFYEA